ncbi:glycosyltransferase family 2 protein [Radicibacter daui]|uniref:glycosyltransferase family 2 protein n=1 Tax=Radicibacter daui TaxID=3064829 RepID=UPI004046BBDB
MLDTDISLFVATPSTSGAVSDIYLQSMLTLQSTCSANDVLLAVLTIGQEAHAVGARNLAVSEYLSNTDFSHLLLVDPSVGFNPETVVRWLTFDRDIVIGALPQGNIDWEKIGRLPEEAAARNLQGAALRYELAFPDPDHIEVTSGFAQVLHAPLGFSLIRRGALEKLVAAHQDRTFTVPEGGYLRANGSMVSLFERAIDPETKLAQSEDMVFCRRAREAGFDLWLDTQSRVVSTSTYYFRGDVSTQFLPADERRGERRPTTAKLGA